MGGAPSQETEERRHEPETRLSLYSARRHDLLHHRGRAQGARRRLRAHADHGRARAHRRALSAALRPAQPAAERHSPHPLRLELLCPARLSDGHAAHVAAPDGRAAHGRLGDLHHLLRQPRLCPRRRAPDPARAAETESPHCHRRRADRHSLHPQPREARGQSARLRGDPHGNHPLRHVRHTLQAAHPAARRTGHHDLQHGPRRAGAARAPAARSHPRRRRALPQPRAGHFRRRAVLHRLHAQVRAAAMLRRHLLRRHRLPAHRQDHGIHLRDRGLLRLSDQARSGNASGGGLLPRDHQRQPHDRPGLLPRRLAVRQRARAARDAAGRRYGAAAGGSPFSRKKDPAVFTVGAFSSGLRNQRCRQGP